MTATALAIDLDAVVANWRLLAELHQAPTAAVLKADAYGTGAMPAARRLHAAGCRHVFVAHLAEAIVLRPVLPGAMIAALNGLWPGDAPRYRAHGIAPVLGSPAEIAEWRATGGGPALIHVDTGLNRLGLAPGDLDGLDLGGAEILYVLTHLASAEDPADAMNERQRARFAAACDRLPPAPRSLANSSGIFLGPAFRSDLARPGAALYGINPTPGRPNPMRAAVRLRARILQVRDVAAGETVGYNGAWRAARPSRIATVSAGYADGLKRSLSNAGAAVFDGAPVPLVGRVSMDLTTYDVTDTGAAAGDWLDLIGPGLTVDDVAARAGTNGYEILTSLGRRYARAHIPA